VPLKTLPGFSIGVTDIVFKQYFFRLNPKSIDYVDCSYGFYNRFPAYVFHQKYLSQLLLSMTAFVSLQNRVIFKAEVRCCVSVMFHQTSALRFRNGFADS